MSWRGIYAKSVTMRAIPWALLTTNQHWTHESKRCSFWMTKLNNWLQMPLLKQFMLSISLMGMGMFS
jgi:hypothetical protein